MELSPIILVRRSSLFRQEPGVVSLVSLAWQLRTGSGYWHIMGYANLDLCASIG